jgi:hypothetical protein
MSKVSKESASKVSDFGIAEDRTEEFDELKHVQLGKVSWITTAIGRFRRTFANDLARNPTPRCDRLSEDMIAGLRSPG